VALSDRQVELGFWHPALTGEMSLRTLVEPDDGADGEQLAVACTQLADAAVQRRAVRAWVQLLPTLKNVRRFWFRSRMTQALFDAACRIPHLEGLWVKWSGSGIKSLEALGECRSLRHLHIGSATQARDLRILESVPRLEVLELVDFMAIRDLEPLGALAGLEQLAFCGGIWNVVGVDSLTPLSRIRGLRYLDITALKARAPASFRDLARLERLEHLTAAAWWPQEDVAYLRERLPLWRYPPRAAGSTS